MKKTYDMVIVGAGVIGSALALDLAKQGYNIALLDVMQPSFAPTNPERVIALNEGSARYLDKLGLWQDILQQGAGWIKHIAVSEPGNAGKMDMSHQALNDAPALGYVLEIRHVLQAIQKQFSSSVTTFYGARCLGFFQDEHGVSLNIHMAEGEQTIEASLLVGADGTNSFVRKYAGIQTYGWDHNRLGIVASIQCEHGHNDTAYECFKEDGPLALLPLDDGRFSLVWSVAPKIGVVLLSLNDEGFKHALAREVGSEVSEKIGRLISVGERASFPLELRIAKSFAQQHVLLVGNAAHTIHPIAGQGMNLGLRDVAVLADILQQNWAGKGLNKPIVGQTYAEQRRLDTLAVAGFTEGVLETFASSFVPQRWLRGLGLNAMQNTPFCKQFLLQQAAGVGQQVGLKS
ncbi:MAG TPA: ubiquinone biosynthesis protein [Ghiorsea sp.]|nr:ubiquinone biosynthesis protein [Ghiorsea sp.]HIP07487.1 ubiquinone biosynthesis protein [Mariprofundaceae bacterium]